MLKLINIHFKMNSKICLLLLINVIAYSSKVSANQSMKRLYEDLFSDYNRLIRPVKNYNDTVLVHLSLKLTQLLDLNMKQQVMTTNVWLEQNWIDPSLKWNPKDYDGIAMIHVPAEQIWQPDIVLFNNADGIYEVTLMTKAVVYYTGQVVWRPPAMYKSTCEIDVKWFPFDIQECVLKFGSWTYDGDEVDLRQVQKPFSSCISNSLLAENSTNSDLLPSQCQNAINSALPPETIGDTNSLAVNHDTNAFTKYTSLLDTSASLRLDVGIDMSEFYPSVEWDILEVPSTYQSHHFFGVEAPYPDISFKVRMRRKTLFYTVNLIIPVVGNAFLTLLVFYLPSESGEKVTLSISVLVSLTVFFLLLAEIIPPTSLAVPLLGKYLLFTMFLVSLSICVTVGVLNIHFRTPSTHELKPWVRWLCIDTLPKYLFMTRPSEKHLQQELKAVSKYSGIKSKQNQKGSNVKKSTSVNGCLKHTSDRARPSSQETNSSSMGQWTGSATYGGFSDVLDPALFVQNYDETFDSSSFLPNQPSNVELIEEQNSCHETDVLPPLADCDFELVNSNLLEQEMKTEVGGDQFKISKEMSMDHDQTNHQRGSYSSSMDTDYPVVSYSDDVQAAIDGILYIAQRLKDEDEENKIIHDWQFIAMVLDRLFLWIFTFICVIGSMLILLRAPSLYDQTVPIDTVLSSIGR